MAALLWRFLPALVETLNIAIVATVLGGLAAMLLSFGATRNLDVWPPLIPLVRRAMDVMRAFPELVIALFLIFLLGTSPVPAMIAVAFHTAGALGKLFSEVNENIDRKPIEGLKAVGATWFQRMRFGVFPQVAPNYLSYFLLRLEINVRASAILGFVGAGGIGSELRRTIGWGKGNGDETAALFLLLFASIIVIDQLSSYWRARLTGDTVH
jgi:phosphonate transport system permease protein